MGPHNLDILSIIFGSMLGDAQAERGLGTRISFYEEGSHEAYLGYLHGLVGSLGYCNIKRPRITNRLGRHGKIRKVLRFHTWTYTSFNWIREAWYDPEGLKRVPLDIETYLTPLALAIWVMGDGGKVSSGVKLSTNCFKLEEVDHLRRVLTNRYKIKASIKSAVLYIPKESMPRLAEVVRPYIVPSMKYKLNN